MINNFLRKFIEKEDVVVLIDDVIVVEIAVEEEYNEIMEEILKKEWQRIIYSLNQKNLWEVVLLEVVIELDRVKMGNENVQGVVDWPVLREVKDV